MKEDSISLPSRHNIAKIAKRILTNCSTTSNLKFNSKSRKLPSFTNQNRTQYASYHSPEKPRAASVLKNIIKTSKMLRCDKSASCSCFLGSATNLVGMLKLLKPIEGIETKQIEIMSANLGILPNQTIAHQLLIYECLLKKSNINSQLYPADYLYAKDIAKSQACRINTYLENNIREGIHFYQDDFKNKLIELSWLMLKSNGQFYFYNPSNKERKLTAPAIVKNELNYLYAVQKQFRDIEILREEKKKITDAKTNNKEDFGIQSDMNTIMESVTYDDYKQKKVVLDSLFHRKKMVRINKKRHVYNLLNLYVKNSQSSKKLPLHSFLNLSPRSAMGIFKPIIYEEGIQTVNNCANLNNTNCKLIKYKSHLANGSALLL